MNDNIVSDLTTFYGKTLWVVRFLWRRLPPDKNNQGEADPLAQDLL
jgi:hypothetical protein